MQGLLQQSWTSRKAHLDTQPAKGEHYGYAYDGTAWRRR
jgi:hypothetical protein